jgi:hypothetical protein
MHGFVSADGVLRARRSVSTRNVDNQTSSRHFRRADAVLSSRGADVECCASGWQTILESRKQRSVASPSTVTYSKSSDSNLLEHCIIGRPRRRYYLIN